MGSDPFAAQSLAQWSFGFGLALCRCGMAVMFLPGVGEAQSPPMVRAGFTLTLVLLILPSIGPTASPDGWQVAGMIAAELLAGGLLGWLASCVAQALPLAGQIGSTMVGLSSVLVPDSTGQSAVLGRLFSLSLPVLIMSTGLWTLPVGALARSYDVFPVGHLPDLPSTVQAAVSAASELFSLSVRLASPLIIASTSWQIALALLGRLVPHLQVFALAAPGQILGGLLLLALLCAGLLDAWSTAARGVFGSLPGLP